MRGRAALLNWFQFVRRVVAFPYAGRGVLLITGVLISFACDPSRAAEPYDASTSLAAALQSVSSDRMLADIRTLAGPEYNGRQTGTSYDQASAEFVRRRFSQIHAVQGLGSDPSVPGDRWPGQTWLQSTTVPYNEIAQDPLLQILITADSPAAVMGSDYLPVLDSPSADIRGSIVFVGYGISDPTGGIDEYAGMDVRNKVVLFLRGKPDRYSKPVSHAEKARTAQAHGAIGYLTATGPILTDQGDRFNKGRGMADQGKGLYDDQYARFRENQGTHQGYEFQHGPAGSTPPPRVTFMDNIKWWTLRGWRRKKILAARNRFQQDIIDIKTSHKNT